MKLLTRKQKELWNEAVNSAMREVMNYDGLVPSETDRKVLCDGVKSRVLYKIPEKNISRKSSL